MTEVEFRMRLDLVYANQSKKRTFPLWAILLPQTALLLLQCLISSETFISQQQFPPKTALSCFYPTVSSSVANGCIPCFRKQLMTGSQHVISAMPTFRDDTNLVPSKRLHSCFMHVLLGDINDIVHL